MIKSLFERYHYLGTLSRGCLDIYELINEETGEVIGATQVGIPCTRHIDKNTHKEIKRFVLIPEVPKNTASYFISKIIKDIKIRYPNIQKIIAYSDPNENHKGTIYKASNFKFVSQSKPKQTIKIQGTKQKLHLRTFYGSGGKYTLKNKSIDLKVITKKKQYKTVQLKGNLKFEYDLK